MAGLGIVEEQHYMGEDYHGHGLAIHFLGVGILCLLDLHHHCINMLLEFSCS